MSYCVIQLDNSGNNTLATVHESWLTPLKKEVFWPPYKDSKGFKRALIQAEPVNAEKWILYGVQRIFYQSGKFSLTFSVIHRDVVKVMENAVTTEVIVAGLFLILLHTTYKNSSYLPSKHHLTIERFIFVLGELEKALKKEREAEITSDLTDSDLNDPEIGRPVRKKKKVQLSSDEEDDSEYVRPPQTKITKIIGRYNSRNIW